MKPQIIVAPEEEILTLAEAKEYLKITYIYEDTTIEEMAKAAREACENYCNRGFLTQTVRTILKPRAPLPEDGFTIGWGKINSVVKLQPVAKGADTTFTFTEGTHWWKTEGANTDQISFDRSIVHPLFKEYFVNSMVLEYVVGTTKENLAKNHPIIVDAVKSTLNYLFDTRNISNISLPIGVRHMLKPYKILTIEEV